MEFNGKEGAPIPLAEAKKWTKNYRDFEAEHSSRTKIINAHFFGRDIIEKILAETGCMGIRIYYALDDSGEKHLLLVGAKKDMDNILPTNQSEAITLSDDETGMVANDSLACPPDCPKEPL